VADENATVLPLAEAADMLKLPAAAVQALVGSGYLVPRSAGPSGLQFRLADLKAFVARNADKGDPFTFDQTLSEFVSVDPQDLLDALDGRSEEMARRVYDIFSTVFPEAAGWTLHEKARFVEQAKARFEAMLAVASQGAEVDEALVDDLQEVGAQAARAGSPLPQLLVILRISRDLVVQTAVELAEDRGRHWGLALSLLLTRVMPALDRLTDALAQGYWAAILGSQEEARSRYEYVVEQSSDGIYEVDLNGRVLYANPSLAIILGRAAEQIRGARLSAVMQPIDRSANVEETLLDGNGGRVTLAISRADGVRRVLDIETFPRWAEGALVGFQGIVRDETAARDLDADKNEFLALVTYDLRTPLTTILGIGATIESHPGQLPPDRIGRMGESIRRQAERIARLADDLYDVSRLEASTLLLRSRPVDVRNVVEAALASVPDGDRVDVRIPAGSTALADPRRLEQVVANLVENAVEHGAPPVVISLVNANSVDGGLVLEVADAGEGVPQPLVPTLFSGLRTLGRRGRDRSRGTGLGLSLVRGLVEAMGGRVWYEARADGGAAFRLSLAVPRSPGG
jgi:PAS domain S-box-containing protein